MVCGRHIDCELFVRLRVDGRPEAEWSKATLYLSGEGQVDRWMHVSITACVVHGTFALPVFTGFDLESVFRWAKGETVKGNDRDLLPCSSGAVPELAIEPVLPVEGAGWRSDRTLDELLCALAAWEARRG